MSKTAPSHPDCLRCRAVQAGRKRASKAGRLGPPTQITEADVRRWLALRADGLTSAQAAKRVKWALGGLKNAQKRLGL